MTRFNSVACTFVSGLFTWWTLASPDNHGVDIAGWTDSYE